MTEISNIQWAAMSDAALLKTIGFFIRRHRLDQNKTQFKLSAEAGINRTTLSLIENGESSNLLTFIQILRALKLLHLLQEFQVKQQISPIQLAKSEQSKRIRARPKSNKNQNNKSDW
jgi:transcriptional regulator with XRE-family HTH domain